MYDCPGQFRDSQIVGFLSRLHDGIDLAKMDINFSTIGFVTPYGALMAAIGIREIVRRRKELGLPIEAYGIGSSKSAINYLKYFGFFQFIGVKSGNELNTNSGNSRYIPISKISSSSFSEYKGVLQEQIDKKSFDLAKVLFSSERDAMKAHMLAYCLREIIRNVFEHADIDECFIMAQKWNTGYAEIAIADEGIGIYESLKKVHQIKNAAKALELAILPGITQDTSPEDESNYWQNSGFGLYVLSELGRQYGEFAISSNGRILHNFDGDRRIDSTPINGTLVKLKIRTQDADYFPNILKNIVDQGEKSATSISGARKSASKRSKLITGFDW